MASSRNILNALLVATSVLISSHSLAEEQPMSVAEALSKLSAAQSHKSLIERVARLASEGKADEVLSLFAPVARKSAGDATFLAYINEELIPFFSGYQRMDTYSNTVPQTFPDGSEGLFHFVYFVDSKGNFRPFMIGILVQGGTPYVGITAVDKCIKGSHVKAKGRCGG